MAKKPDFTQVAFRVFQKATGLTPSQDERRLSPKAVSGRKGGLKGGKARKAALTKRQRSEIASLAAHARWDSAKARKRSNPS